jgi:hypothetical protein
MSSFERRETLSHKFSEFPFTFEGIGVNAGITDLSRDEVTFPENCYV